MREAVRCGRKQPGSFLPVCGSAPTLVFVWDGDDNAKPQSFVRLLGMMSVCGPSRCHVVGPHAVRLGQTRESLGRSGLVGWRGRSSCSSIDLGNAGNALLVFRRCIKTIGPVFPDIYVVSWADGAL